MNKNRLRGERVRTNRHETTKSITIKGRGRKAGGRVTKDIELTAGGLPRVSGVLPGTESRAIGIDRAAEASRGHSSSKNRTNDGDDSLA
jgi:hypothetical protein